MALHETLHIYMSFHLRERSDGRSHVPRTRTRSPGIPRVRDFRAVGDRSWHPPPSRDGGARVREREERSGFVCLVFLFFSEFFFSLLFTLQRDSGGLRPELLVTRDSCVLRSPAGLKPDKDYHTLEMLYLPAARVKAPLSRASARLILPLGNRDTETWRLHLATAIEIKYSK